MRGTAWQLEYERQWRTYTTQVLAARFGGQHEAYEVTPGDLEQLRAVLHATGSSYDPVEAAKRHAAPRPTAPSLARHGGGGGGGGGASRKRRRRRRRSSVPSQSPSDVGTGWGTQGEEEGGDDEGSPFPETQVVLSNTDDGKNADGYCSDVSMRSDESYVYHTPDPKKQHRARAADPEEKEEEEEEQRGDETTTNRRRSATSRASSTSSGFPSFSVKDMDAVGFTRTESASHSLRQRFASMSPIEDPRITKGSTSKELAMRRRSSVDDDDSLLLFQMRARCAETEECEKSVVDLDVSMQSMHLSQGDASFQEVVVEEEEAKEEESDSLQQEQREFTEETERICRKEHEDNAGMRSRNRRGSDGVTTALNFDDASNDDEDDDEMGEVIRTDRPAIATVNVSTSEQQQQHDTSTRTSLVPVLASKKSKEPSEERSESPKNPVDVQEDDECIIIETQDADVDVELYEDLQGESCCGSFDERGADQNDSMSTMIRDRFRAAGLELSDDDEGMVRDGAAGVQHPDPFASSSLISQSASQDMAEATTTAARPSRAEAIKNMEEVSANNSASYSTDFETDETALADSLSRYGTGSIFFRTKLPLPVVSTASLSSRFNSVDKRPERSRQWSASQVSSLRIPECRASLLPYQRQAVDWMTHRELNAANKKKRKRPRGDDQRETSTRIRRLTDNIRGGILADEMGLGKTICCIALICESLRDRANQSNTATGPQAYSSVPRLRAPTLIITPLSILTQWEKELRDKTNLSVLAYQGAARKRIENVTQFMGVDVVLSTYDTLRLKECKVDDIPMGSDALTANRQGEAGDNGEDGSGGGDSDCDDDDDDARDVENVLANLNDSRQWRKVSRRRSDGGASRVVRSRLHQLMWHRVILDESHLITNAACARAKAASTLRSKRRWCVTGTPIQNSGDDLASLLSFIGLPTAGFHDSGNSSGSGGLDDVLLHVMLRRFKSTVDQILRTPIIVLPKKYERIVALEFVSDVEKAYYGMLHRSTKLQVLQYIQQPSANSRRRRGRLCRAALPVNGGGSGQCMHIFELLLRLRQCCDSYALVTQDPLAEVERTRQPLAEIGIISTQETALLERAKRQQQQGHSTKIISLLAELQRVKQRGEQSLVISQWTSFLDMITDALQSTASTAGISIGRLDGRMSAREREASVAAFQHDRRVDVLLISLRTGGLGLNLTAASYVFIMEPSWNPSLERQAVDRAHRMGQTRPVHVVRFVMENSIEERVVALQEKKRAMAAGLLGDGDDVNPDDYDIDEVGQVGRGGGISGHGSTNRTQMNRKKRRREARLSRADLRALFSQMPPPEDTQRQAEEDNSDNEDDDGVLEIWEEEE